MQAPDAFIQVLDQCLADTSSSKLPASGLVVLEDSLQLPSFFLIQSIIKQRLQQGGKVVLVPVSRSPESYRAALRKLGLSAKDSGVLEVVDVPSGSQQPCLPQLAVALTKAVQNNSQQQPSDTCILIDSLTDLECLTTSDREWLVFLHLLASLACQGPCQVCAGVHADSFEDPSPTHAFLTHAAQVVVHTEPVEGQIAGIHGQVRITQRRSLRSATHVKSAPHDSVSVSGEALVSEALLFRCTDQGVQWITQLTSRQLLWE